MKKLFLISIAAIAAVSACAISQNQFADFKAQLEALQPAQGQDKVSKQELDAFVANNGSVVNPVAIYALDNPVAFRQMIVDNRPYQFPAGVNMNTVLRIYVDQTEGLSLETLTDAQDALVTGGSQVYRRARTDSGKYQQLKADDMTVDGIRIRTLYAIALAQHYRDLEVLASQDTRSLAFYFDRYLAAVDSIIANSPAITDAQAYEIYADIERKFTPYQSRPKVAEQMARLRENMDSAYVRARRSLP